MRDEALRELQDLVGVDDYAALHSWSIANLDAFWRQTWADCELVGDPGEAGLHDRSMAETRFFPNGRIDAVRSLLDKGQPESLALIEGDERGNRRSLTRHQLFANVAAVASALLSDGVKSGDRVAIWTPNVMEAIEFALGALSIGAVVCSAAPEFSPGAVIDRFGQTAPSILLSGDKYSYSGREFDMSGPLAEVVAGLPTVQKVIHLCESDDQLPQATGSVHVSWTTWTEPHIGSTLATTEVPFDHPGFILFSSGTTGKPKCIVHSIGGILLKVLSEQRYHFGLDSSDRACFYSTCGWMMWNWSIMILASGATLAIYNGSPSAPDITGLLGFADRERLSFLGVSPKYLELLSNSGFDNGLKLDSLETLASTGSPLAPEMFDFVHQRIKSGIHLVSMSGGTDICGCFLLGIPTQPITRGEIQGAALGMAVDVFDSNGNPCPRGTMGELVCTSPFPSQPLGFLGDDDGSRYRGTYFAKFPGVWTHGDFLTMTDRGGYVIHGRSDATLNRAGIRIGTAEIYGVVNHIPEIVDSIVVGERHGFDIRIILFVTLREGVELTTELKERITAALRSQASPRHVPDEIACVPGVPRTISGKLAELVVSDIVNGDPIRNTDGLESLDSLDAFHAWRSTRS
jgi:acetoacetyl-CoA synthetase